jgi:hypothetical protein
LDPKPLRVYVRVGPEFQVPSHELLEEGAPLSVVQRQLRHRDARTTLQKYGHVVGDAQRRAVNTLAEKIERHVTIELEPSAELEPFVLLVVLFQ